MAVTLPEIPSTVGERWHNPETGIDYEWNGKRWVAVVEPTDLSDVAFLSKSQTFNGDLNFNGTTNIHVPKRGSKNVPVVIETGSSYDDILKLRSYESNDSDNRRDAILMRGNGQITTIGSINAGGNITAGNVAAAKGDFTNNVTIAGTLTGSSSTFTGNLKLAGGNEAAQTIISAIGFAGTLAYGSADKKRLSWGDEKVWIRDAQLDLVSNKIINVADASADNDVPNWAQVKVYADAAVPDTSAFLRTDGTRAMTGLLNMGNNTINSVATPNSPTAAANRRYVDDEIASSQSSPQMQLQLWQYKGMASSQTEFQALRQGEFMIRHKTTSGNYDWELAINVKDKDGRYWYPFNGGSKTQHTSHSDYVTINDCFGATRWGGKQDSLHFNEHSGIGSYLRVDGRWWKQTYSGNPFTTDWWYIIKLSGILPHWKYPLSVQQNGQSSFNTDYYGVDDSNEELADANGSGEQ